MKYAVHVILSPRPSKAVRLFRPLEIVANDPDDACRLAETISADIWPGFQFAGVLLCVPEEPELRPQAPRD